MANHRQRRRILSDSECYSSDCYSSPPPSPPSPPWSSPSPSPSPTPTPTPTPEMSPNYSPPIMSSPDKFFKKDHKSSKSITLIVVLFLCALALAFLFLTYLTVRKQRNSRGRISRRRRRPSSEEMENRVNLDLDLLDDNQGPVLDHPIWYIRTVGLQQSVIDSITIFKYKRGERLIEGADCSVCLSEFEEDETLRLLPKCSHAFHIHCIDTWLSSHQNCPLCRAPIVSPVSVTDVPNSTVFTISDQAQSDDASTVNPDPESLVNSHSQPLDHMFPDEVNMRLAVDQFSVEEEDEDRVSGVSEQKDFPQGRNNRTRVLSDIGDHRRSVLKEEESVGRRSVSMDALSAAHLTSSFLAMVKADGEGCSSNEPAAASSSSLKNSSKKKMRSNSLVMDDGASRVTNTYSFGRFLQRGPPVHAANLKRSTSSASSSGGFFSLSSRH